MPARPVHVGCAGWAYPHWRGRLYPNGLPQRRWLSHYAERYDTVEVNSTFYRLASPAAVENWVEQSPKGFVFAVKASRYLTHARGSTPSAPTSGASTSRSRRSPRPRSSARPSGSSPESSHRNVERLDGALKALPDGRHAFEFRHASWFTDEVYELLRRHRVALVISDEASRWVKTPHVRTADWTYIRFHHGSRGRHGNYSDSEIDELGAAHLAVAPRHRGLRLLQQRLGGLRPPQRGQAEGADWP